MVSEAFNNNNSCKCLHNLAHYAFLSCNKNIADILCDRYILEKITNHNSFKNFDCHLFLIPIHLVGYIN